MTATRNQTEPRPSSKAPTSKHLRLSRLPERRLHTARCQNRMPGRRHTEIVACPPVTATRYPERRLHTAPATRKPAAAQRSPRAQQLLQEALCTTPATQKPAAAQRRPRAQQLLHKTLCLAPTTREPAAAQPPRPSSTHARSSSSRRLCVLRLPHESQPLCGKGMR